jgi:hypothetical protein
VRLVNPRSLLERGREDRWTPSQSSESEDENCIPDPMGKGSDDNEAKMNKTLAHTS